MGESSGIVQQAEFHANRPFFYIISEQSTGVIFFMGQYMGEVTANLSAPQRLSTQKDVLYNLQGQRLTTPPTKGIYIKNGRKVVIKWAKSRTRCKRIRLLIRYMLRYMLGIW